MVKQIRTDGVYIYIQLSCGPHKWDKWSSTTTNFNDLQELGECIHYNLLKFSQDRTKVYYVADTQYYDSGFWSVNTTAKRIHQKNM